MSEDNCAHCNTHGFIKPLEPLKPNIHGLKDHKGNIMMEQRVYCQKCSAEWVDVFCRVYPNPTKNEDAPK